MPIAALHSSKEAKEVKSPINTGVKGRAVTNEKWTRVDAIIDEMYCDACNGKLKSEIVGKLMNGQYINQRGNPMKRRNANYYYSAMLGRLKEDFEDRKDEMLDRLFAGYYNVYQDAVEYGDRLSAIKALDGITKIMGYGTATNAIQINGSKDGNVNISFGFQNSNDEQ